MRLLPSFLVIGAAKSGTTSLHQYLRQHPQISLPACKETNFFALDRTDPHADRYEDFRLSNRIDRLSAYLDEFELKSSATVRGEVCPFYLVAPNAPTNIRRHLPGGKLIAILRNPIDRAFSSFNFGVKNIHPYVEFGGAVRSHLLEHAPLSPTVLEHGLYFKYLSRYYGLFPEEQIQVYLYEQFQDDPQAILTRMLDFIGLPGYGFDTRGRFNPSGEARSRWLLHYLNRTRVLRVSLRRVFPLRLYQKLRHRYEAWMFKKAEPMTTETRSLLIEYYRDDIQALQDLIRQDLSGWLTE